MPSIQQEATSLLSGIPFDSLIGGPMNAAIDAQVKSAKATADFIQGVAFHPDTGESRHVEFVFEQGAGKTKLQVPLLAIVPVPFLRIEELNINFKASISSETSTSDTQSSSTEAAGSASGSVSVGWGPVSGSVSFSASYSSKQDSKSTKESKYSVQYTIDISCRAVQDDMPAGLAEVLAILRENIKSDPIGKITQQEDSPLLELPLPAPENETTLDVPVVANDNNGDPIKAVMVEFSCDDPNVVVMTPRSRTGDDGKTTAKIKYKRPKDVVSYADLAEGAMVGSLRLGAKAPSAVGSVEIDLKAPAAQ